MITFDNGEKLTASKLNSLAAQAAGSPILGNTRKIKQFINYSIDADFESFKLGAEIIPRNYEVWSMIDEDPQTHELMNYYMLNINSEIESPTFNSRSIMLMGCDMDSAGNFSSRMYNLSGVVSEEAGFFRPVNGAVTKQNQLNWWYTGISIPCSELDTKTEAVVLQCFPVKFDITVADATSQGYCMMLCNRDKNRDIISYLRDNPLHFTIGDTQYTLSYKYDFVSQAMNLGSGQQFDTIKLMKNLRYDMDFKTQDVLPAWFMRFRETPDTQTSSVIRSVFCANAVIDTPNGRVFPKYGFNELSIETSLLPQVFAAGIKAKVLSAGIEIDSHYLPALFPRDEISSVTLFSQDPFQPANTEEYLSSLEDEIIRQTNSEWAKVPELSSTLSAVECQMVTYYDGMQQVWYAPMPIFQRGADSEYSGLWEIDDNGKFRNTLVMAGGTCISVSTDSAATDHAEKCMYVKIGDNGQSSVESDSLAAFIQKSQTEEAVYIPIYVFTSDGGVAIDMRNMPNVMAWDIPRATASDGVYFRN